MIGVAEVKFCEELCFRKSIQHLTYERDGIPIFNGHLVKAAIINAEPYGAIRLRDE
jgi:hypothetical protein